MLFIKTFCFLFSIGWHFLSFFLTALLRLAYTMVSSTPGLGGKDQSFTMKDNIRYRFFEAAFWGWGFPDGSEIKMSACNAGDPGLIPGSGRSPEEGDVNPLQYSCLENPMDRGAWQATVHGVSKSQTWLSDFTFTFTLRLRKLPSVPSLLRVFLIMDVESCENVFLHLWRWSYVYLLVNWLIW